MASRCLRPRDSWDNLLGSDTLESQSVLGLRPRWVNLPGIWYPEESVFFLHKIPITQENLNQNLKYFNPLVNGPGRLEWWKNNRSEVLLDCPYKEVSAIAFWATLKKHFEFSHFVFKGSPDNLQMHIIRKNVWNRPTRSCTVTKHIDIYFNVP